MAPLIDSYKERSSGQTNLSGLLRPYRAAVEGLLQIRNFLLPGVKNRYFPVVIAAGFLVCRKRKLYIAAFFQCELVPMLVIVGQQTVAIALSNRVQI